VVPPNNLDDAIELLNATTTVVAKQEVELTESKREIVMLRQHLALMRQGIFGRRSEKLHPNQISAFEAAAEEASTDDEYETIEIPARKAKKKIKGHGKGRFGAHLPREDYRAELAEADRLCPCCGKLMVEFGADISERGRIIPPKVIVCRYHQAKYACPDGHGVKSAPLPENVVDGGKYDATVYGHIATLKYSDHLPLNRISGILKRYGIDMAKSTMNDLLARLDELVAQPIIKQMRAELLEHRELQADETPFTTRIEGEKTTKTGFIYTWQSIRLCEEPKILIDFRMDRSRTGPRAFLADWTGVLLTDGYAGYNEVAIANDIERAGCWAHGRRKFADALKIGSKAATRVLRPIHRLFWIERAILKRADGDEANGKKPMNAGELLALRERVRAKRSTQVLEQIYREADALKAFRSTLPKSALGKALGYLKSQAGPLRKFLDWPSLPIHNNDAERTLRHCVVGRKNYLFFGSPRGGEMAARLYSLVLSCRANDVNPEAYIVDVLTRISTTPFSEIASLTPWGWKAAQAKLVAAKEVAPPPLIGAPGA
jgi:transposase